MCDWKASDAPSRMRKVYPRAQINRTEIKRIHARESVSYMYKYYVRLALSHVELCAPVPSWTLSETAVLLSASVSSNVMLPSELSC